MSQENKGLVRGLGLGQATMLNMIDMVGIGPFVALPIILLAFPGHFSLIPWIFGAIVSLADGLIWAEMGAAWPEAGGSFIFLQKLYRGRVGRMFAFLYSMQTSIHLPLVITSASLGLVNYLKYAIILNFWQTKMVMIDIVVVVVALLYRKISSVGKIGMVMSVIMVVLLIWTIITGLFAYDANIMAANSASKPIFSNWQSMAFWFLIGQYTSKSVYAYLGYYNVCNIGGEIKNPEKNIPKSIVLSIIFIAILYIGMQWVVAGSIPIAKIKDENAPLLSILFEQVYGKKVAYFVTAILVVVACSSLFALMLGYSRIIYASAKEGLHFKPLAHIHPTKHFPDYVLIVFGAIAVIFCLIFNEPSSVFSFIVITRIFIQFIPQAIGVMTMRFKKRQAELPFKMPLYPVPVVISILTWLFLFFCSNKQSIQMVLGGIVVGIGLYFFFFDKKYIKNK